AGLARKTVAHNVTINNLLPGIFDTDRLAGLVSAAAQGAGISVEEARERRRASQPAGRFGDEMEFGQACAYLCSAQAGYITGQNFLIDGGSYPGTFRIPVRPCGRRARTPMGKAIRIEETGGPEVMRLVEHDPGAPAAGELRIRNHAVGVNFIDVYFRTGAYPMPLPGGIGMEGAGVVEAIGDGVSGFAPGDRVAYAAGPPGAYAQVRNMAAKSVVALPDAVDFESAAALM